MSRRRLKLLTRAQIEKLTTKRLLAYRDRLLSVHEGPNQPQYGACEKTNDLTKDSPEWKATYSACKEILGKREHVGAPIVNRMPIPEWIKQELRKFRVQ